ncbi:MAG: tRNA dihydrouridine synthase DusB [Pseudomonadales bacterium]|nr:tRNA dihydrouridine synthase DusB [Pseudomonadales bacterium]
MLTIGTLSHPSRVIVAPMAGVTDQPFRNVCRHFGAFWVVSEMITSDTRLWHTRKSQGRLCYHDEVDPRWVQIAGGEPAMLADAARQCAELGAQVIDINMGCPAKKVCNRAAGSALMRDEALVAHILAAVVRAVDVPVTLKMRLGWSRTSRNAVDIARIAEDTGISLVTVHGRTRACKFEGEADYDGIAEVKAAVSIPVVANGDIDSPRKAGEVLRHTGCDAVMVGRAAQGRPWLPAAIDYYLNTGDFKKNPDASEIKAMLVTHIIHLSQFYGEVMGVRIARKHVGWYLQSVEAPSFRKWFNTLQTTGEQVDAIEMMSASPETKQKYVA